MREIKLDYQKMNGLVPAIIQDHITGKVLMLGFMNEEAYQATLQTNKVHFFSRSRNTLWMKGETSGNFLIVKEIMNDCDNDSLLILAEPAGPTCHTGDDTCFKGNENFFRKLITTIKDRKTTPNKNSYTSDLFQQGIKRIAQKVGEEGIETALAAVAGDKKELLNESADLIFHLLVLLEDRSINLDEVIDVLKNRQK